VVPEPEAWAWARRKKGRRARRVLWGRIMVGEVSGCWDCVGLRNRV
jgi:hypothetical protein